MKKSILVLILVFATMTSFAQFRLGLGLVGGVPVGNFKSFYTFGIGGYLEPKYGITEHIDVGVNLTTMGFLGADIAGTNSTLSAGVVTPILAIGHYYFANNKVYAGIGVGPYLIKNGTVNSNTTITVQTQNETKFGFAPKVGVNLGAFDLGVAYNIVKDGSFLGINIGFNIFKRG